MLNRASFKTAGKMFISGFLVFQILFGYAGSMNVPIAQAQLNVDNPGPSVAPTYSGVDQSLKEYLCVPDESNKGVALFNCITKIYKFGVAFGAIALVFFIVYAGYLYMTGGEATKEKGKSTFISALTGMAIILSSYVLLGFINPDLVRIKPIQPPIFTASNIPLCSEVGLGQQCVLPDGQVSPNGSNGGSGPASGNMKQWQSQITAAASEQGIEYCALYALVDLESGGGQHLIVSNGPPGYINPNHSDKKSYGLPFTRAAKGSSLRGHGIGLGQIYIYGPPPSGSDGDRWAESNFPSRPGKQFGFSKPLTITDLINPQTNLKAAAYHFAKVKLPSHNNYADAYASNKNSYHGAGSINGINVREIYQNKYLKCKAG